MLTKRYKKPQCSSKWVAINKTMLLFKYDFPKLHDSQRRFNGGSTVGIPFSRRGVKRRLHQTEQWLMRGRCSVTAVRKWLITQLLCKSRGRLSGKPILRRLFGLTASCPVLSCPAAGTAEYAHFHSATLWHATPYLDLHDVVDGCYLVQE